MAKGGGHVGPARQAEDGQHTIAQGGERRVGCGPAAPARHLRDRSRLAPNAPDSQSLQWPRHSVSNSMSARLVRRRGWSSP